MTTLEILNLLSTGSLNGSLDRIWVIYNTVLCIITLGNLGDSLGIFF